MTKPFASLQKMKPIAHLLSFIFVLIVTLFAHSQGANAQGEVNVMNPYHERSISNAPQILQIPYQPRRRYQAPKPPVQDEEIYGPQLPDAAQTPNGVQNSPLSKVLVIGDTMADALANGLEANPALMRELRIIRKISSSSGLVRDDFFDWPNQAKEMIAANRDASAIFVMLGLNDNQIIRVGAETFDPLSDGWITQYQTRVDTIALSAKEAGIPLIWVGIPPIRSQKLSNDLLMINTMVKARIEAADQVFISVLDAFTDASGQFSMAGSDIIGDTVRLRTQDGIHFTPAGQRKLAFFVEPPLRAILALREANRQKLDVIASPFPLEVHINAPPLENQPLLESKKGQLPLNPITAQMFVIELPPVAGLIIPFPKQKPAVSAVFPLIETPKASALMHKNALPKPSEEAILLFDRGIAPAPRAGRSDDFAWDNFVKKERGLSR